MCTWWEAAEAGRWALRSIRHMAQHLCQTGPVSLASAKRLTAGGQRSATCRCGGSCRHAECLHQVAAAVHPFQWRQPGGCGWLPAWMWSLQWCCSQLTPCINSVPASPQPHAWNTFRHLVFTVGAVFALPAVQHSHFTFLQLSEIRADTLAIQLLLLWATIMAFRVTYQAEFWVGITAVKLVQFITLHDVAPQFCTLYSCILFQIKWKKFISDFWLISTEFMYKLSGQWDQEMKTKWSPNIQKTCFDCKINVNNGTRALGKHCLDYC